MYILLTNKNTVAEIIPDENPVFPGVPIEARYASDFVARLLHVADDTEVQQGWSYVDGTFVEPIVPEPEIPPETMPDYIADLRAVKIEALSDACESTIYAGTTIKLSDGSEQYFTYDSHDQSNIFEMYDAVKNGATRYIYQAQDGSCMVYSKQDVVTIYGALAGLKTQTITYYHQLKDYIEALQTAEEINAVTWGQELTGEYLTRYNDLMAVAQESMNAVLTTVLANG